MALNDGRGQDWLAVLVVVAAGPIDLRPARCFLMVQNIVNFNSATRGFQNRVRNRAAWLRMAGANSSKCGLP